MKKGFNGKSGSSYLNISSIEELRLARAKLEGEIREKERDICDDFNAVVYMLSPARIIAAVSSKLDCVKNIAAGIRRGYEFIHDIMAGERNEEKMEKMENVENVEDTEQKDLD